MSGRRPDRTRTALRTVPAGSDLAPADALDDARDRALGAAAADAAAARPGPGGCAHAVVAFGDGYLALAVTGVVEAGSGERLLGVLDDLRTRGRHELAVECSGLARSSPALVRFLGYVRLQQVAGHGRLALHRPPADLLSALGEPGPDHLAVHDPRPAVRGLRPPGR